MYFLMHPPLHLYTLPIPLPFPPLPHLLLLSLPSLPLALPTRDHRLSGGEAELGLQE